VVQDLDWSSGVVQDYSGTGVVQRCRSITDVLEYRCTAVVQCYNVANIVHLCRCTGGA
jgi:hypothetical protein